MALKIKWTKRAANSFDKTVKYLQTEWNLSSAQRFVKRSNKFLQTLVQYPRIGKIQNSEKEIRAYVLSRHISVFYRIKSDQLILLKFFNNRQNPSKRPN